MRPRSLIALWVVFWTGLWEKTSGLLEHYLSGRTAGPMASRDLSSRPEVDLRSTPTVPFKKPATAVLLCLSCVPSDSCHPTSQDRNILFGALSSEHCERKKSDDSVKEIGLCKYNISFLPWCRTMHLAESKYGSSFCLKMLCNSNVLAQIFFARRAYEYIAMKRCFNLGSR